MAQSGPAVIKEVEQLKEAIGWSWNTIADKLGWSIPHQLTKFRSNRLAIPDDGLRYLREVAAALSAIRAPDLTGEPETPVEPVPVEQRLAGAGYHPRPASQPQEIAVMMLTDIAEKLAIEYREIQSGATEATRDMTAEERAGATWAVGQMARRLGVHDMLREALRQPAPGPERIFPFPALRDQDVRASEGRPEPIF